MRKLSILVAASSMLFAACSKDDSVNQNLANEKFFASSAVTRTAMGDNGTSVHWVDGDLVSIFNKTADNLQYKATQVAETTAELVYVAGTRTTATMSSNFALYPYDADATLSNGVITTSIPAAQSFSADANLQHSIMVAKSESNSFSFVNATSLLRFDVKSIIEGATIKTIAIQSQANNLAGDVTIDLNAQTLVAVVANDAAAKEIVLDCGDAVLSSTDYTSFYAVVPATEFAAGDLTIVYTVNYDGNDVEVEYPVQSAMSLGAGVMKWTQFTISESFSGSTSDMATAIAEMKSVFENGGDYTLDVDVVLSEPLVVKGDVTLNLNGRTITNAVDNTATDVILVEEGATLTIDGDGLVEAVTGNDGYTIISNGTLIINDGTYKSGIDANGEPNAVIYARGNGEVYVNGGYFPNDNASKFVLNKKDADRATTVIEVRGGVFGSFDPANNAAETSGTNFMAPGYTTVANGNEYIVVAPTEVASEEALLSAITANKPVVLTSDIQLDNVLVLNSDATIVLNGKTITSGLFAESGGAINEGTTDSYVFWVKDGTLNIYGDGEINASEAKYSMAVWADGGTVNIYGGTYKNNYSSDLIYAKNGGVVNIYGGEFIASNKNAATEDGTLEEYSALNLHGTYPGTITVYGGSFYKFNPADNLSENPKVNFVAAGYQSVQNGDYWVVSKQ
ncbi:MAG: hypothetical protein IJ378_07335 [Alistipes sp.]|nr:hypothetical protein [Alistipes sp.]